jgi:hypothetical protein
MPEFWPAAGEADSDDLSAGNDLDGCDVVMVVALVGSGDDVS